MGIDRTQRDPTVDKNQSSLPDSLHLDEIDLQILQELQQNSSAPLHELAEKVGLSKTPCQRRIKRMEKEGIIQRYVAILNPEALEVDVDVFINVRLYDQTLRTMKQFRKIILTMPEIVECYVMTGVFDFFLHVRIAGVKAYNEFMQEKLLQIPGIAQTQSSISLERLKYSTALPIVRPRRQ